jgi:hypothetical protein
MNTLPTQSVARTVASVPLILGLSAFTFWAVYMLQRSGLLAPDSFERFVQRHLDEVAMTSLALAVIGVALGLYLGRGGRRTKLMLWGTLISVAGALAQLLLPL